MWNDFKFEQVKWFRWRFKDFLSRALVAVMFDGPEAFMQVLVALMFDGPEP